MQDISPSQNEESEPGKITLSIRWGEKGLLTNLLWIFKHSSAQSGIESQPKILVSQNNEAQ